MTDTPTDAALSHLRILDLTRVRAGPTCCRVFADFGADVIKIEAPGAGALTGIGGGRDGYDMQNLHRNKRSLTLDLKTEEGREIFLKMVEDADAVVENFRPRVKERLDIGYDVLAARNPRIILVSISGFGEDGPYRDRAGYDQIAQGMGGMMSVTGLPGQGPVRAGAAIADHAAGLNGALGLFAALLERGRSGRGQWVRTSLLEAQVAMMDFQCARYLVEGDVPAQAGNDHPVTAPMGVFATSDGHINIGVGNDGQWRGLCAALDRPDLAAREEYADAGGRTRNRLRLREELEPSFAEHSSEAVLARLEAESVPAGPILAVDGVFADPQVRHLGLAAPVETPHPRRGDVTLVRQGVTLSRTPPRLRTPTPDAGEHTDALLDELGFDAEAVADLRARRVV